MLTLSEARRRSLAIDPVHATARGRIETALWERRSAVADVFTPRLSAQTSYTRFSDPFFNFGTGEITPNATSAVLSARYSLLGLGKLGGLKAARASLASAEAGETASRFNTTLVTDAAYFAVVADRELVRVSAERLRRAEEQFGVARARVQAGEAIASDSLQLLLELNRARLAVLRGDSALAVSRLRLGRQAGLATAADAAPVDSALPPPLPLGAEQATAELRAQGPMVIAARADERRAEALVVAERERYLPEITVDATTGAYDSQLFPSAMRRSQVGVTVALPLWDAGSRELGMSRLRVQRDVARAERADTERAAAEEMARAHHGYTTARAAIELAQVGVAAAAESYRVQRARYGEGATTILELLEAQVALGEAEAELVRSRHSARLALAQIEALLGRRLFAEASER